MQAIEFETQLSHGAIPVLESLHLVDGRRVRVLLLLEESEDRTLSPVTPLPICSIILWHSTISSR